MKRLPRTYFGDPILRKKAKLVAPKELARPSLKKLTAQMFFTMRRVGGVGLAAPQIGKAIQLAVIEIKRNPVRPSVIPLEPTVVVNPKILNHSRDQVNDWEGCLSFPNVRGLVPRYKEIRVSYFDKSGERQLRKFKGFQARVFQHEIDHLNGLVYVDKLVDMKNLMTLREFKKRVLKKTGLRSK